ncbi:hypothetical protein HR12_17575, partial [Microbacterium sp. SUBG005]
DLHPPAPTSARAGSGGASHEGGRRASVRRNAAAPIGRHHDADDSTALTLHRREGSMTSNDRARVIR